MLLEKQTSLDRINEDLTKLVAIRRGNSDYNPEFFRSHIKRLLKDIARQKDIDLLNTSIDRIKAVNSSYSRPIMKLTDVFLNSLIKKTNER